MELAGDEPVGQPLGRNYPHRAGRLYPNLHGAGSPPCLHLKVIKQPHKLNQEF